MRRKQYDGGIQPKRDLEIGLSRQIGTGEWNLAEPLKRFLNNNDGKRRRAAGGGEAPAVRATWRGSR